MKFKVEFSTFKKEFESLDLKGAKSYWLHSFDEAASIFLRQKIKEDQVTSGWTLLEGRDLTIDWIENNLVALSLFADDKPVAILNAMSVKKNIFESLMEALPNSSKFIYLFSHGKNDLARNKKYSEVEGHIFMEVSAAPFWEYEKMIIALFSWEGIELDMATARFLVMRYGQNFYELLNALRVCQLNFPYAEKLMVADIKELFQSNKHIDRFFLADLFNEKKILEFWDTLLKTEVDLDEMKSFFSFMVSHIVKIIDPSYTQNKKKISAYDKKIIKANRHWNHKQLDFMLEKFSNLIISCKQKKDITHDLRSLFLIFQKRAK